MTWEAMLLAGAKFGLNLLHAVVGAVGALLSLTLFDFPESVKVSARKKLAVVVAGFSLSGFGTEFVLDWFKLGPPAGGITGLVVGLFGISLAMKIFETIQQANVIELIRGRFGRP